MNNDCENVNNRIVPVYALNLFTVSISQIIDYNDINILEQEKDTILNDFIEKNKKKEQEEKERIENARVQARSFYQKPIVIVYNKDLKEYSEILLKSLSDNIQKLDYNFIPPCSKSIDVYVKENSSIDKNDNHIIFLGDSKEAKKIYKGIKNKKWDYNSKGMKYVSYSNKTVIMMDSHISNKEIDDIIKMAKDSNLCEGLDVPTDVKTIEYNQFLKETIFEEDLKDEVAVRIFAGIIGAPLLLLGQGVNNVENGIQQFKNLSKSKQIKMIKYAILFEKYLKDNNAIIQ